MSSNANIAIRIASVFNNKGFKDASKQTTSLEKGVKKLGKTLAGVFGAQQLLKFAKNASKAFIEDEKAASQLARAVNNLGLAFETPAIERFIKGLATVSGVTDDQLRPSMQKLLQVTGSVTKSQELLTQALDVSRGSGVDFETVTNDLAQAYVGNLKGLRKYNLGLTQAELKSSSFADVQERLTKTFSGASAAFLDTYAGKIGLLSNAAGEASETIGGALVDSLISVFAAGDPAEFVAKIDTLATKIADTVASVVFGFKKLYILTSDRAILASFNPFDNYEKNALAAVEAAEKAAKARRNVTTQGYIGSMATGIYTSPTQEAARKNAEAAAVKRAKELAALQKKTLATQKSGLALGRASKTLDLERIGIESALKNQISETDRLSLNLQLALLDKNETQATKLAAQLEAAIKRQNELSAALLATPKAPNPYADWKIPPMGPISPVLSTPPQNPLIGTLVPNFVPPPWVKELMSGPESIKQFGPQGGLGAGVVAGVNPTVNVTVLLDNGIVAGAVSEVQTNNNLSGSFTTVGGRGANTARFT